MFVSRSSFEKPRSFERCVRTTSPSSTSTWAPRRSSSAPTRRDTVVLPAPESPVSQTVNPGSGWGRVTVGEYSRGSAILFRMKRAVVRRADPYRDTQVIDERAPRVNQAVVGIVALVAVVTGMVAPARPARAAARARPHARAPLVPRVRLLLRGAAAAARRRPARGQPPAPLREHDRARLPRRRLGRVPRRLDDASAPCSAASSRRSRCSRPSPASAPAATPTSSSAR